MLCIKEVELKTLFLSQVSHLKEAVAAREMGMGRSHQQVPPQGDNSGKEKRMTRSLGSI